MLSAPERFRNFSLSLFLSLRVFWSIECWWASSSRVSAESKDDAEDSKKERAANLPAWPLQSSFKCHFVCMPTARKCRRAPPKTMATTSSSPRQQLIAWSPSSLAAPASLALRFCRRRRDCVLIGSINANTAAAAAASDLKHQIELS